ncbi:MAG: hypothetical protein Q8Q24_01880 [bacterium]|nr:hypothetical protein [bacterium]
MSFESLLNFQQDSLWEIVKFLFLFAIFLYIAFSLVVVKQIFMMTKTIGGQLEVPLKIVAILHLFAAIFVFILAIITL